jgi:anti-anti-sigma factor
MTQLSEIVRDDGVCVVSVVGELDLATVEQFLALTQRAVTACSAIEVDLGGLSFIDSSGLSALLQLRNETTGRALPLSLSNVGPSTHRLFRLTGLLDVFDLRAHNLER